MGIGKVRICKDGSEWVALCGREMRSLSHIVYVFIRVRERWFDCLVNSFKHVGSEKAVWICSRKLFSPEF
jgi:hypothetical protein